MADNLRPPFQGTGDTTPSVATDDVGSVHYQKVKLDVGGDGVSTPVNGSVPVSDNGGSLTVDGTITANAGTGPFPVSDNGGSLTVDQPTGSNLHTVVDSGTITTVTNVVHVDDNAGSLTVDNAGTFAVQDSQKPADRGSFTQGTTPVQPGGFILDEVAGTLPAENTVAVARINENRAQVHILEDGTTRGQRASVSAGGALKTDSSATTQPVSGTVTANVGTTNGLALDATLTGGTQKTKIVDTGGTNVATVSAAGAVKTDGSAVTQPVSGTVTANIGTAGTLALDASVTGLNVSQGSTTSGEKGPLVQGAVTTGNPTYTTGQTSPVSLDTAGAMRVHIAASDVSSSGGTSAADGATYTAGTTSGTPMMGARDDTSPGALAEDKVGIVRLSTRREMYTTIRDAAGNERGANVTAGGALQTDASATTQPVSGTVTATQGTGSNLHTVVDSGTITTVTGITNVVHVDDNAGSLTVDNGGTFAVQDSQVVTDNAAFTDGTTKVQPVGYVFDEVAGTALTENDAAAARIDSKRAQIGVIEDATTRGQRASVSAGGALKVDGSAVTQPVSGTVTTTPPSNASTNLAQVAGTTTDTNSGVKSAGTIRVVLATDQPQLTNKLLVTPDANSAVNCAQVSGTAIDTNSGNKSAGTQRIVLATDQPTPTNPIHVDDNSGSLTVDAPVGTPVFATPTPSTTGGWSKWSTPKDNSNTALTTTVVTVKGSAGTLGGYIIYNPNASAAYVQVFDVSGTVTLNTTRPDVVIPIPATSGANIEFTNGVNFANAIKAAATTTDSGSTAPGSGLTVTFIYK